MAKATSLKLVPGLSQYRDARSEKSEVLTKVRKNVEEAVNQLRSLGRDYEKAAWMLEDSLNYALSENDRATVFSDEIYSTQGVDWVSLTQVEELLEGRL